MKRHSICGSKWLSVWATNAQASPNTRGYPASGPVAQLRQLAIEAGRQVVLDLVNLLVDHVKIVDQPICSRGDGAFLTGCRGGRTIGCAQRPIVVAKTLCPTVDRSEFRCDALSGRETLAMLLEPLDTEEFRTDRLFLKSKAKTPTKLRRHVLLSGLALRVAWYRWTPAKACHRDRARESLCPGPRRSKGCKLICLPRSRDR